MDGEDVTHPALNRMATVRFSLELGRLQRHIAEGIEAYGWQLGLDVQQRATTGWLRTYGFVINGELPRILRLLDSLVLVLGEAWVETVVEAFRAELLRSGS